MFDLVESLVSLYFGVLDLNHELLSVFHVYMIRGQIDYVFRIKHSFVKQNDLTFKQSWRGTVPMSFGLFDRFPKDSIHETLSLIKQELPSTTDLVEEGHATGAVLMKGHDQLGVKLLFDRCMVHQCRHLVSLSKEERTLRILDVKLDRLDRWRPTFGGRQMYFRDLCKRLVPTGGGTVQKQRAVQVMQAHARLYRELSFATQAAYDIEAGCWSNRMVAAELVPGDPGVGRRSPLSFHIVEVHACSWHVDDMF